MIERLQDLPSDALGALVAESEEADLRFVRVQPQTKLWQVQTARAIIQLQNRHKGT